jgi:DNA polymerase V
MGGHGGTRPGAGRRPGTGKFGGEPTQLLRVPAAAVPVVVTYLDEYRRAKLQASVPATPATLNPPPLELREFTVKVPAGFLSPADDYLEDGRDLNRLLVRNAAATFFYTVSGESMDRAGILDGDKVIVDRSLEAVAGDIIIGVIPGDGHTIKRLNFRNGRPYLMPESNNPEFKPRSIKDNEELIVWGVVTGSVRQYRR